MGFFDFFRRAEPEASVPTVRAMGEAVEFFGLNDPRMLEFIRGGGGALTESGITVSVKAALKNTTVIRCVSLISFAMGYLPLHLRDRKTKEKADDHPLFRVLHRRPNAWQTAFEFRSLMQQRALVEGDAYAQIVRSGRRIIALNPLAPNRITPRQRNDWSLEYEYQRPDGGKAILPSEDVFHLRYGMSDDGICGLSTVKQAAEAIALALQSERAAARLFRNGMLVGGALKHKNKLSPEAYERLKASMEEREGAGNAHKWMILEEDMEIAGGGQSGRDSQHVEQRKHQIEEIARAFGGIPRPLLVMDDTSWGSGIDVLGQLFVRFTLNPWFEAWQQAIERDLLSEDEADRYEAKFNEGALLRGSMKDQAEFWAKALGSGGHQPWMKYPEVREMMDLPEKEIEPNPLAQRKEQGNEPPEPA